VLGAVLLTVLLAMISFVNIPWYFSLPVALGLAADSSLLSFEA